jgi:hypothetical protein
MASTQITRGLLEIAKVLESRLETGGCFKDVRAMILIVRGMIYRDSGLPLWCFSIMSSMGNPWAAFCASVDWISSAARGGVIMWISSVTAGSPQT